MKKFASLSTALMGAVCCVLAPLAPLASANPQKTAPKTAAPQKVNSSTSPKVVASKKTRVLLAQDPTLRPPAPRSPIGVNSVITQAEKDQDAETLLLAYGQAATNSTEGRLAISQLLTDFYALRNRAITPEQATQAINEASLRFQVYQTAQNQIVIQQNQQLIQQNTQIIQLLQRATAR